jgi:hypothetical protein
MAQKFIPCMMIGGKLQPVAIWIASLVSDRIIAVEVVDDSPKADNRIETKATAREGMVSDQKQGLGTIL